MPTVDETLMPAGAPEAGISAASCQADSVPAETLRGIVRGAFQRHIGPHLPAVTFAAEEAERAWLAGLFGERVS